MCRFRVNRRHIRHIFHRFQNVPASCVRSLSYACLFSLFKQLYADLEALQDLKQKMMDVSTLACQLLIRCELYRVCDRFIKEFTVMPSRLHISKIDRYGKRTCT